MRVERDDSGHITLFEMFDCNGGQQRGYLRQTIDGTGFTMVSKGSYSDPGDSGGGSYQADVSGTLNAGGLFTAKTISTQYDETFSGGSYSGSGTFTQGASSFGFEGFSSGVYNDPDGGTGSYSDRVSAEGQLLDGNSSSNTSTYNVGLLAMGDGALKGIFQNSDPQGGEHEFNEVQSWNGDTTEVVPSNDFTSSVEGLTPPALGTVSISFGPDESYDCAATVEGTIVADMTVLDDACMTLAMDRDWIDCWQIITEPNQNQGPPPECEGPFPPGEDPPPECDGPPPGDGPPPSE